MGIMVQGVTLYHGDRILYHNGKTPARFKKCKLIFASERINAIIILEEESSGWWRPAGACHRNVSIVKVIEVK